MGVAGAVAGTFGIQPLVGAFGVPYQTAEPRDERPIRVPLRNSTQMSQGAAIEAVEMVGFVNFCAAVEKAYALDDVMSEEKAVQLAAADDLSLERSKTNGHLTGFVGVVLTRGGKFHAGYGNVTIGICTGRFEAALEHARFMRRNST